MISKITFTSTENSAAAMVKNPQPDKQDTAKKKQQEDDYQDPLNDWKLRALSYSNEIGAALNVITPKLGAALWIPTFMYLGADIYDKYKNDKDVYSPSSKRGLEQVISQSVSSILLPAIPILVGQKMTSPIGKIFSDRLSINEKDASINEINLFIDQIPNDVLDDKAKYKEHLRTTITNRINVIKHEVKTDNILKKIYKYLNGNYALWNTKEARLEKFIEQNCNEIFEIKENLEKGIQDKKLSKKLFNEYTAEVAMKETLYGGDTTRQALRKVLKKYENTKIFRNKLIKTFGGIAALILLIKPIDNFTQKTLIDKFVDPGIDRLNERLADSNLLKMKVNEERDAKTKKKTGEKSVSQSEQNS